jgi:hypothetical protein
MSAVKPIDRSSGLSSFLLPNLKLIFPTDKNCTNEQGSDFYLKMFEQDHLFVLT